MTPLISYAKRLVKENKVKAISSTLFEVEEHKVMEVVKKGRCLILCDCDNASYFGHNQFCVHKLAVINYLCDKDFYKQIDKLIELYENWKDMNLPVNLNFMINDLKNLREIK